jgi:glycerol kinase
MAHQTNDLKTAFAADGADWAELRIDGGMVANDWMAQDLADMLDIPVERPAFIETTAMGAAMLAGVGAGLYPSLEAAAVMRRSVQRFAPDIAAEARETRLTGWADALSRVLS